MAFRTRRSLRTFLVSVVVVSGALLAQGSNAQAAPETASRIIVNYGDLDLNRNADARRLYQRLRAAAGTACSQYDGRELYKVKLKRQCMTTALHRAVQQIDHPALVALHEQRQDVKVAQKTVGASSKG